MNRRTVGRVPLLAVLACLAGCGPPRYPVGKGWAAEVEYRSYVVEEGKGALRYTATKDGLITVHELPSLRTIQSAHVRRGARIVVDPVENVISVGGSQTRMFTMEADAVHQIRVDRGRPVP